MTEALTISRAVARRFLAIRHFLAPPRSLPAEPGSVMTVIERIASFQFDPLEVAGRNHDLVLLARVDGYERSWTERLLYDERVLFEANNKGLSILPISELPFHRITWDRARARHDAGAFTDHAPLVEELLGRIRANGPLGPGEVGPREAIDWYWRPTNQVRALLEALAEAGILGLARRDGNRRVYDLVERLFSAELLAERRAPRDQFRHRLLSRYRGHGLLGASGSAELWHGTTPHGSASYGLEGDVPYGAIGRRQLVSELVEAGELQGVDIEGVKGRRYCVADELSLLAAAEAEVARNVEPGGSDPGVAFLAPLDPLVWDRDFLRSCYEYDYLWEVYVPAAKRRWGYYVLPILFGDVLVGRIEPRIDRRAGTLRILGLWWEDAFEPLADERFVAAFAAAIDAHRRFGGVRRVTFPRTARVRSIVPALRERLAASSG